MGAIDDVTGAELAIYIEELLCGGAESSELEKWI